MSYTSVITTLTRPAPLPFNMRLRGAAPHVDIDGSNFTIQVGAASGCNNPPFVIGGPSPPTLGLGLTRGSNAFFLARSIGSSSNALGLGGLSLSASDRTISQLGAQNEPFFSIRTAIDKERIFIGTNGVFVTGGFAADTYADLVPSTTYTDAPNYSNETRPPSVAALLDVYTTLSNFVQAGPSNAISAPPVRFINDYWIRSAQDGIPRLYFDCNGTTRLLAPSAAMSNPEPSFVFETVTSNVDAQSDPQWAPPNQLLTIDDGSSDPDWAYQGGSVWIKGAILLGGSNAQDNSARVAITHEGSNVGINLPVGVTPVCTLHVNGEVFSSEDVYALSDMRYKTNIQRVKSALKKVHGIMGCTYNKTNQSNQSNQSDKRHLGVLAQQVREVVPEAVHVDSTGRMSVAYGNLVALAFEAIKELDVKLGRLEAFECPNVLEEDDDARRIRRTRRMRYAPIRILASRASRTSRAGRTSRATEQQQQTAPPPGASV